MLISNFVFLEKEFIILFNIGQIAESYLHTDPITSLFKLLQRERKMAIAEWPVGCKWADYGLFIGNDLFRILEAKTYRAG